MSAITDTLIAEFQYLTKNAVALKEQIDKSKTKTKKEYLTKKLHRNNNQAIEVVVALDKLKNTQSLSDQVDDRTDDETEICEGIVLREQERQKDDPISETSH